jgi:hypothetical protein
VLSKRKDAIYCSDRRCRNKAYLAKKQLAASAPLPLPPSLPPLMLPLPLPPSTNKASVVVTFPDGGRWLLELTPLHATAQAQLPTLTQVPTAQELSPPDAAAPPADVGAVRVETTKHEPEPPTSAPVENPSVASPTEHRSAQSSAYHSVAEPSAVTIEAPAAGPTRSSESTAGTSAAGTSAAGPAMGPAGGAKPPQHTVELYFVDRWGRRIRHEDAIIERWHGGWVKDSRAQPRLGFSAGEGRGFGGTPGRWREYYRYRSPTELGFDPNIGVLCWRDDEQRAYAPEPAMLKVALGPDWREQVRKLVESKIADSRGGGLSI